MGQVWCCEVGGSNPATIFGGKTSGIRVESVQFFYPLDIPQNTNLRGYC